MDFLDSLDLQTNHKSNRMRSWYLYEQYKSLERHQLDAAERLKNRSYQERLLHRELAEHHSRRRLYQQCGLSLSEHSVDSHGVHSALSSTTDDFFETFCELNYDFQNVSESVADDSPPETEMDKAVMEDFQSLDIQDDTSCAESITSVVEKTENDLEFKSRSGKLDSVQRNLADKINQQLESVKDNMLSLEKYVRSSDTEDEEGDESLRSGAKSEILKQDSSRHDNNFYNMWSRLVSFAYQIIQLNHGNCYYDYSSQLMTAVLACDVLRRGVNSMCDNLQHYVSPIEFIESPGVSPRKPYKKAKRKKYKRTTDSRQVKINSSVYKSTRSRASKHSANLWRQCSNSFGNNCNKERRNSEQMSSSERYWPKQMEPDGCECICHSTKIVNPMLKLVRHLDNILKSDIDFFVQR